MAEVKGVSVSATTVKLLKDSIKELKAEVQELNLQMQSENKTQAEQEQLLAKVNAKTKELADSQLLLSKATETTKGAVAGVSGSYAELVAETNKLRKEWRTVDMGSERFKELSKQIDENNNRLKMLDSNIGDNYRNVGNYVGAISPLTFQINQLVREMPSLTVSANQFFLAISNNLPMFADEVSKLRIANQELAAQGKPTVNILSQIVKGVFSWQTALVVLITVLTQFGGKMIEWIKTLGKAKVSIDDIVVSINQFATSIETERRELNALFSVLKNAEKGTTQYAMAKKQIQDKYGSYLQNQTLEIRNLIDLAKAYEVLEGKINATAIAKAMEGQRSEIIKEYQEAVNSAFADENILQQSIRTFGEKYGTELFTRIRTGIASGIPELEKEAQRLAEILMPSGMLDGSFNTRVYWGLDGQRVQGVVKNTDDIADALERVNTATETFNYKMQAVNATATQMGNLLGVNSEDIEEVKVAIVDTTGAMAKFKSTEELAKDIAKQTAKALRELKEEYESLGLEMSDSDLLAALEAQRKATEQSIRGIKSESSDNIRNAELEDNEKDVQKRIYEIRQQALLDEMALLQQGLENYIYIGDEKIKVEERIAKIKKDLAYNTAKYENDQAKQAEKDQKAKVQGWVAVGVAAGQAMSSILGEVADMYEQNGEANEESLKKAKNIRIAGATMDMLGGITAAIAGAFTTKSGPWDFVLAGIQAATILASGIANIAKIKQTDTSGNSGASSAVVTPPAMVQQVPVTRTLTGAAEEERLNESRRVYVVYDDIAQAGHKVEVTENEATF